MSEPPPLDVAVVGEIYIDHVFSGFPVWPKPGEEIVTDAYVREIGGGAAITACALARLGRRVTLVGLVGCDDRAWLGERLALFGIGLDGIVVGAGQSGITVSLSTVDDRSFFTHVGVNRQIGTLLAGEAGARVLASARHVHFAMPIQRDIAQDVLPVLAANGVTTSLDMGYQPAWLADPANHATLAEVDHLLPNEKEAELIAGSADVASFFRTAEALRLRAPMMKRGAAGAIAGDGDDLVRVAPPTVVAVDTTGAGDAFDAGFIDALLDGASPRERLERACIAGALSTRRPGALAALPDAPELWSTYDRTYRS